MTTNLIKSLLIAALIASGCAHADNTISVTVENGKKVATFTLAGSHCVLVDDHIRCTSAKVVVADNDR